MEMIIGQLDQLFRAMLLWILFFIGIFLIVDYQSFKLFCFENKILKQKVFII